MALAFEKAGYKKELGRVTVSNRPDLCEYQCNGAMAGAKEYKKAPIMIANSVAEELKDSPVFESVEAVMPGFLNCKVRPSFLTAYIQGMRNYSGLKTMQIIQKIRETDAKSKGLDNPNTPVGDLLKELIFFILH